MVLGDAREQVERRPPGVRRPSHRTRTDGPALRSAPHVGHRPAAVLPAQRRQRQLEQQGVTHQRAQVEVVTLERVGVLVGVGRLVLGSGAGTARAPRSTSSPLRGRRQRRHSPCQGARIEAATSMPPSMESRRTSATTSAVAGTTLPTTDSSPIRPARRSSRRAPTWRRRVVIGHQPRVRRHRPPRCRPRPSDRRTAAAVLRIAQVRS